MKIYFFFFCFSVFTGRVFFSTELLSEGADFKSLVAEGFFSVVDVVEPSDAVSLLAEFL